MDVEVSPPPTCTESRAASPSPRTHSAYFPDHGTGTLCPAPTVTDAPRSGVLVRANGETVRQTEARGRVLRVAGGLGDGGVPQERTRPTWRQGVRRRATVTVMDRPPVGDCSKPPGSNAQPEVRCKPGPQPIGFSLSGLRLYPGVLIRPTRDRNRGGNGPLGGWRGPHPPYEGSQRHLPHQDGAVVHVLIRPTRDRNWQRVLLQPYLTCPHPPYEGSQRQVRHGDDVPLAVLIRPTRDRNHSSSVSSRACSSVLIRPTRDRNTSWRRSSVRGWRSSSALRGITTGGRRRSIHPAGGGLIRPVRGCCSVPSVLDQAGVGGGPPVRRPVTGAHAARAGRRGRRAAAAARSAAALISKS